MTAKREMKEVDFYIVIKENHALWCSESKWDIYEAFWDIMLIVLLIVYKYRLYVWIYSHIYNQSVLLEWKSYYGKSILLMTCVAILRILMNYF